MKGLYYFLVSSGKGYIFYNVAMILGFFAIKYFFRRNRSFCVFVLALLLSNLLVYSFIFVRGSLFSWGPRYLFPTLPLFALFLAEFMSKNDTLKRKAVVFMFAVIGFLIQLPNFFVNFSKYLFFVKEKLGLSEYLIDFMPELSPIKGAWALFLSLISRFLGGGSLSLSFNPDLWFFTTTTASLDGYDVFDIWWANVSKISGSLAPYVMAVALAYVILGLFSFYKISTYLKEDRA